MIDFIDSQEVVHLSDKLLDVAYSYAEHRNKACEAKTSLELILSSRLPELRKKKSNLGYDMALLMLLESADPEIVKYFTESNYHEAQYRGLEFIRDALTTKISLTQTLVKNQVKNT